MDNHEIEDGVEQELELEKLRVELELLAEDHRMLTEENEQLKEVVLNENLRREERLDVQEVPVASLSTAQLPSRFPDGF